MSLSLDKSGWKRVAFGDVIDSVTDRVNDPSAAGVDRYVGLEHLDPGVLTVERWDSPEKVEAQKLRFKPGDVIFGRRRAYQKKVARADFEGICSAHALVLRAKTEGINPDFLPVFLASDYFLDRAVAISVGSLSPTVNWRDLKVEEFDLPSKEEQKRIADLFWAVEGQRKATDGQIAATQRVQQLAMASWFEGCGTTRRLGDLSTVRSGPSYPAASVSRESLAGSVPVLGIPNTKSDGTIDLTHVDYVAGLPDSTWRVDETSLILIRTNGNRQRIGNVYIPPPSAFGHAVSAFQFLMKVKDPAHLEYLYRFLGSDGVQLRMSEAASGTTGLGNLAAKWLNELEVPWPDSTEELDEITADLGKLAAVSRQLLNELATLGELRSALSFDVFGERK